MDEPLSNLDAKLRVQMRSEVARIQHELQATTVYVTHDQVEAMTMGDRVALMRRGVLQQVDTPLRLYNAPANLFVASFIGSPAMNLFEAKLERSNGYLVAQIGDQFLRLEPDALAEPGELERYDGKTRRAGHPARAPRGRGGGDRRAERAPAAGDREDGRGARLRADRPPRARRAARAHRRGEGDRGGPRRLDAGRARGRGARRQAAARRPLRRRLAGQDGRSRSRWWSTRPASTTSTSTPASPSAAIRWRRTSHGHHRRRRPPSRRAPRPGAAACASRTRPAPPGCSCCPASSGSSSSTRSRRCAAST